jgi:hypothetical protein
MAAQWSPSLRRQRQKIGATFFKAMKELRVDARRDCVEGECVTHDCVP